EAQFTFGESIPDDLPEVAVIDPGFVEPEAEEEQPPVEAADEAPEGTADAEATEEGDDKPEA
ncbi:MAG: hypothetical protein ACPGXK_15145, partial [Phycisphaerae bacterium]